VRTARRVAAETEITTMDNAAERARREVGRPSTAEAYRDLLVQALTEEPTLRTVELLHRARQVGYTGGKSAVYALAQTLRTRVVTPLVRFEGLPGEFSQHDFGEVRVRYQNGTEEVVHFASRLRYSRWAEVTLVPDEQVEALVRAAIYNPFVGNYMMEAFTTEIGGEVYLRNKGIIAMATVTGGEIRGTVPGKRGPTVIGKLGVDRQASCSTLSARRMASSPPRGPWCRRCPRSPVRPSAP
jgi:hypothetical protein